MSTTTDTVTEENVCQKSWEWLEETSRMEKLEYLYETCSKDFLENTLIQEMVTWMGEAEFTEFFKHLVRNEIVMTPPMLELAINS